MGDQGWEAWADVEESELQRDHYGILEFLRCDLQSGALDAVGHAELWEGPADADDGNGPRGLASAVPQRADWRGVFQTMSAIRKTSAAAVFKRQLMGERELGSIADTVLRLAKSIGVAETEVHVDETISALTRF